MKTNTYMRLSTKSVCISTVILLFAGIMIIAIVNAQMRKQALINAENKAHIILKDRQSTILYYTEQLRPPLFKLLKANNVPNSYFEPTWMSGGYANREIHKYFKTDNFENYYYKNAAANARNPENEADNFELGFLKKAPEEKNPVEWSGILTIEREPFFVIMRPNVQRFSAFCMRCHSTPDKAPADLVRVYGSERSFNRKIGEIASVISVRIPLKEAYANVNKMTFTLSLTLIAVIVLSFLLHWLIFHQYIVRPINKLRSKVVAIIEDENNLGQTVTIDNCQEMFEFSQAFSQVSLQLRQNRDNLEALVEQRTMELSETNKKLSNEIIERTQVENEREKYHDRLKSLWNIAQMTEASYKELCDLVLDKIQKLTDSQYSFFGFLSDDERVMIIHSWSKEAMNGCAVEDSPIHFPVDKAGLWSQAVISRKALIVNDYYRKHTRKKGLPDGHVPIHNILSVPIIRKDKVFAIAAVANKRGLYTTEDEKQVYAFVSNIILLLEKRKSEEALRESDERLKLALDSVTDAVWDWRVETGEIYFSSRWYTMLGYVPYELPQKYETFKKLIHHEDLSEVEQTIFRSLESGETFDIEFRMQTKEGRWKWILDRGRVVEKDDKGKAVRMLGTHVDITERKKLEERLQQSQKIESIGNLAGGIAHDFNNILFPIVGMSELLLEDLPNGSLEYENAQEILKAGKRGSDLVKQILTFSRQHEHKMIPVRVQQILKEVLKLCRSTIPSNIEISQNIQGDCGLIMADPTQVHQVAMNLITNAYHAVEATGGTISIQLRETTIGPGDRVVDSTESDRYAVLSISDTGCGISQDFKRKIFEPYFTTKEQGKGTGLGLAVVHGIVKEHRGVIKVNSEIDKGSTFDVYLPLMEKSSEVLSAKKTASYQTGNERILLVDDEEPIVRLEEQMLNRLGYHVTSRLSSVDALGAFKANPESFNLVITDMAMPNMTGVQLAEKLIAVKPDIPIIICTGFSEGINQEKVEAVGIKGILMKPVVKSEMANTVRKVLEQMASNIRQNAAETERIALKSGENAQA